MAALTEEVTALRPCSGWLEQAERGQTVVANLRPDADPEAEDVVVERWRILRMWECLRATPYLNTATQQLDAVLGVTSAPASTTPSQGYEGVLTSAKV